MTKVERWRDIGCFLLLTLLISSIFYVPIIVGGHVGGGAGAYVSGLMWAPGVSACLTLLLRRRDFRALGFSWGDWRYALLAYLVPLCYALIAYLGIWLLGFGGFPNQSVVLALGERLGWTVSNQTLFVLLYFLMLAVTQIVNGVAAALGEEIGWRGFLAPALISNLGFSGGALLAGLIWAAWHMPILLFADYNSGTPWWFSMPCFTVMLVALSFILSWLRLASNSVWPCAILHASHNLFIQRFFTPLTGARGNLTPYFVDEFGLALPLIISLVAIFIWVKTRQPKEPAGAASP